MNVTMNTQKDAAIQNINTNSSAQIVKENDSSKKTTESPISQESVSCSISLSGYEMYFADCFLSKNVNATLSQFGKETSTSWSGRSTNEELAKTYASLYKDIEKKFTNETDRKEVISILDAEYASQTEGLAKMRSLQMMSLFREEAANVNVTNYNLEKYKDTSTGKSSESFETDFLVLSKNLQKQAKEFADCFMSDIKNGLNISSALQNTKQVLSKYQTTSLLNISLLDTEIISKSLFTPDENDRRPTEIIRSEKYNSLKNNNELSQYMRDFFKELSKG